jgi:hypothetical protein
MNNKFLIIAILLLGIFFMGIRPVNADTYIRYEDDPKIIEGEQASNNCAGIFTEEAWELIQDFLFYFRILAPSLLIVLIAVDLTTAIMSSDYGGKDDAMRKAVANSVKRTIAAVLLLFIPTIISIIMNLDGVKTSLVGKNGCTDPFAAHGGSNK